MTDKPRFAPSTAEGQWVPVADKMTNLVSGLGTASDKRSHNAFTFGGLSLFNWVELEAAYVDNWIARQIVQAPVDDAMREWRTFTCKEAEDIKREETRVGIVQKYREACYWARLYGGAVILMITDQELEKPLDLEAVKEGSLYRLVVLDRWDITAIEINYTDPVSEDYLEPRYYQVYGGTTRIHSSHVIRIDGEDLPRRMRAMNQGWGDSTLRKTMEDLKDTVATKGGIATLVQEANVDVINREGLDEELATGQHDAILKRYHLSAQMKSLVNMMLLEGPEKETLTRSQLTFSGLGDIMDKFMLWISGAAEIPATRLFRQSPSGMNATGQGDLTNYYDTIASDQEVEHRPRLERLDEVLVRSAVGSMPDECSFDWNPLYQETGVEQAQQELARAQADDMRLQHGVRQSHVLRRLQNTGEYAITDEYIEQVERGEEEEASMQGETLTPQEREELGL